MFLHSYIIKKWLKKARNGRLMSLKCGGGCWCYDLIKAYKKTHKQEKETKQKEAWE